jgi:hypothetical protein
MIPSLNNRMQTLVRQHYPLYHPSQHALVLINPNASELLPQRRWMPENTSLSSRSPATASPRADLDH